MLVLVLTSACRARQVSSLFDIESEESRIQRITSEKIDMDPVGPIKPSDAMRGMGAEERREFIKNIASELTSRLNIAGSKDPVQILKNIVPSDVVDVRTVDELVQKLFEQSTRIDQFPTVALSAIPKIQAAAFDLKPGPEVVKKSFSDSDGRSFELKASGCEAGVASHVQVFEKSKLYVRDIPIDREILPCFQHNSTVLARALNVLSEQIGHTNRKSIQLSFPGEETVTVSSLEDLVTELKKRLYVVELFTTRVFVDFLAFALQTGHQSYVPLIIPTRFSHTSATGTLVVPGEHSEIGMMIYKQGEPRTAQLRFFLGIPDKSYPGKVAFWRPHTSKYPSWRKPVHDLTNVFEDEKLKDLGSWLTSAALTMNAYQDIQDDLKLPNNSYGFAVCNDSAATMVAVHDSKYQRNLERMTWGFPLIKASRFTSPSGLELDYSAELARRIPVDQRLVDRVYPSDFNVSAEDFRTRLEKAFPVDSDRLLEYFASEQQAMKIFLAK